jgi:hypothetical protein
MEGLAALIELARQHAETDTAQFAQINAKLTKIDDTLEAVLTEHSFKKGFNKAVAMLAGLIATAVGGTVAAIVTWALRASH